MLHSCQIQKLHSPLRIKRHHGIVFPDDFFQGKLFFDHRLIRIIGHLMIPAVSIIHIFFLAHSNGAFSPFRIFDDPDPSFCSRLSGPGAGLETAFAAGYLLNFITLPPDMQPEEKNLMRSLYIIKKLLHLHAAKSFS